MEVRMVSLSTPVEGMLWLSSICYSINDVIFYINFRTSHFLFFHLKDQLSDLQIEKTRNSFGQFYFRFSFPTFLNSAKTTCRKNGPLRQPST